MADRALGVLGVGVVDPLTPLLRADDPGVLRGDGCFETVRVRDGSTGAVDALPAHLRRLSRSAARMDLPAPDLDAWRALVGDVVAAWGQPGEGMLRLVLIRSIRDDGAAVSLGWATLAPIPAETLRQRRDGVRAVTLDRGLPALAYADAPWLLAGVKTTSYAVNMAALREAGQRGVDDAIFLARDGEVLEGPTSAVVWLANGILRTPPAEPLGILASVTVQTLLAAASQHGLRGEFRRGTVADLRAADGVWLVSASRLAAAVVELDGQPLPVSPELTARELAAAGR